MRGFAVDHLPSINREPCATCAMARHCSTERLACHEFEVYIAPFDLCRDRRSRLLAEERIPTAEIYAHIYGHLNVIF